MSSSPSRKAKRAQESQLEPKVERVLQNIPEPERKILLEAMVERSFSGPLPDGESIRIYAEVIPDGGNRLMQTVEKQMEHRFAIESYGTRRVLNQASTGQWMGFTIALLFGVMSVYLVDRGHSTAGIILGSVDLVALVTVFIVGRIPSQNASR